MSRFTLAARAVRTTAFMAALLGASSAMATITTGKAEIGSLATSKINDDTAPIVSDPATLSVPRVPGQDSIASAVADGGTRSTAMITNHANASASWSDDGLSGIFIMSSSRTIAADNGSTAAAAFASNQMAMTLGFSFEKRTILNFDFAISGSDAENGYGGWALAQETSLTDSKSLWFFESDKGNSGSLTFEFGPGDYTFDIFSLIVGATEDRSNFSSDSNAFFQWSVHEEAGAVPEPASWALMLGGFGVVGGTLRASRRKTSIAYN